MSIGRSILSATASLAMTVGPAASAPHGCHFKSQTAIVCTQPRAAAEAFQLFGANAAEIGKSYNAEVLRQAGCAPLPNSAYLNLRIEQIGSGKMATLNGWVPVTSVAVGKDLWFVATAYLVGKCPIHDPNS